MRITCSFVLVLSSLLVAGCGGGGTSGEEGVTSDEGAVTEGGEGDGMVVVIDDDDDRVSTSAGEEGGIVVMWPRVMGFSGEESALLQQRLVAIARRVAPNGPIDIRPEPQRVCPRGGCNAPSLGVLLVVQDGTCATVAIIGRPRDGNLTLVPWTGDLDISDRNIPFREPPESHVVLHDRTSCADLATELGAHEAEVEAALRQVR